ncbi:hypothetical protein [Nonomuraea sp. NPDC023979]|uniref:hypothetical protein n=1 Tax=Nonomuraea sp. NPDC023979 TaxID=3154796 RepID=UPI00340646A0
MTDTTWRYGMKLADHPGPGGTAQGFSRQGCINMLGHGMTSMHRATGSCTCGQYRKDRLPRQVDPKRWCQPCKDLQAAKDLLTTQTSVTYLDRVWYYQEESADGR